MKITELFKTQARTYSFEFFPPKDEISAVDFGINVGQLMRLNPSFVTVTYGAGGSTQERTFALVDYLQNKIGLCTMAHYTCVNASKAKIEADLKTLQDLNIKNVMLLRGDPPKGQGQFIPHPEGFSYANELVAFTKQNFDFCIGSATYPEKHPEAESINTDITHLKKKVDAGAEFLITQLFFDNLQYFRFSEMASKAEINCRIIPGIIPITAYQQIKRFTQMSGGGLPASLVELMESNKDNPAKVYQIGMDFAIQQCRDLLIMGAPGIHFYTLNKSRATVEIFETLLGKY